MDIKIRKATIKDLERIQDLSQKLFSFETQFTDEFNQNWSNSELGKAYFKKKLISKNSIVLVAESKSNIIGYILINVLNLSYRENNPIGEIENMYVEENFRRLQIGSKLMEETFKILKKRGCKRLRVGTISSNVTAIDFYTKYDFVPLHTYLERDL